MRWRTSTVAAGFLFLSSQFCASQLIGYESFAGLTLGSGLTGSGTGASGWSDAGWNGGADSRFQIVDPTPDLSFQLAGGQLVNGSNRAVQVTTNPEPISGSGLLAFRSFPAQNTTLYVSFLIRPITLGTGSDALRVAFLNGANSVATFSMLCDQAQQYLQGWVFIGGSGTGIRNILPGQTHFIVLRVSQSFSSVRLEAWVDPVANFASNSSPLSVSDGPLTLNTTGIGIGIYSTDTAGPTTTAAIDELRVGYTWNDVVPQNPPAPLIPNLQITRAVKLSWQAETGKTYQPQLSYDQTSWLNLGSTINGNGAVISIFDPTDMDAEKFYRVQIH